MNGGVIFLIILLFGLVGGYAGWAISSRIKANRLGLPPPSLIPFKNSSSSSTSNYPAPAPGGIRGFFETQIRKFKNRNNRSAAGAYEEPSSYNSTRGRGAGHRLDPDEAWSARVGDEAYYEEQELGLHAPQGNAGYSNAAYNSTSPGYPTHEPERGRSRTREYEDDGLRPDGRSARDPFGDENAAPSLRGVSPRPLDHAQDTSYGGASGGKPPALQQATTGGSAENSPTERRSMFRENM